ncbi:helix-turn-helix transcriptional regulator [Nocardioides hungaricus]
MALAVVVPLPRDPFLNTDDACGYLGVPKATLLTWRVRRPGYGPRAVKAGGRLKYRLSELDRWLRDHEESFALGEDSEEIDAATDGAGQVRTRNRASRVHGGALPATQP